MSQQKIGLAGRYERGREEEVSPPLTVPPRPRLETHASRLSGHSRGVQMREGGSSGRVGQRRLRRRESLPSCPAAQCRRDGHVVRERTPSTATPPPCDVHSPLYKAGYPTLVAYGSGVGNGGKHAALQLAEKEVQYERHLVTNGHYGLGTTLKGAQPVELP